MARPMCQSCGMPLKGENNGTEKNGSKSQKYCDLCYANGKFIDPDLTAEQMQKIAYKALRQKHWPFFLAHMVTNNIPKLERWNKKP